MKEKNLHDPHWTAEHQELQLWWGVRRVAGEEHQGFIEAMQVRQYTENRNVNPTLLVLGGPMLDICSDFWQIL